MNVVHVRLARLLVVVAPLALMLVPRAGAETRQLISADWRFTLGDAPDAGGTLDYAKVKAAVMATGQDPAPSPKSPPDLHPGETVSYVRPTFDDHGWRTLDLPHDFGIESGFKLSNPGATDKLTWWGVAWYRKHLAVPDADADHRHYLDVDGAMSYSMVWCNGHFVGGWPCGYTSYRLDLTPYLVPGDNVLAVRLDNPKSSSRWYPGGGIYRNVWLVTADPVHVDHWGTVVTTPAVTPVPPSTCGRRW